MEKAQSSGQPLPLLHFPHVLISSLNLFCFQFCLLCPILPTCTSVKSLVLSSPALLGPGWPGPTPVTFPPRAGSPALTPLWVSLTSPQFVNTFPVLGGLKPGTVSGCIVAVLSRGGQHIPLFVALFMTPVMLLPSPELARVPLAVHQPHTRAVSFVPCHPSFCFLKACPSQHSRPTSTLEVDVSLPYLFPFFFPLITLYSLPLTLVDYYVAQPQAAVSSSPIIP